MAVAPSAIVNRVAPEHRQKLATPISTRATGALRTMLTAGLMRPIVPDEIASELVASGYAHEVAGGLALTGIGQVRAMMEVG